MAILPESGPSAIVSSFYFLITQHYLGYFLFTISQQKNTSSTREDACLSFTPTPQIVEVSLAQTGAQERFVE